MKALRSSHSLPTLVTDRRQQWQEPLGRYQYEELKSSRSVRLLRLIGFSVEDRTIFGTIRDANLDEIRGKYLALSYTWGEAVDKQYYPTSSQNRPLPKTPCTLVILDNPRDEYRDDINTVRRFGQKTTSGPRTGHLALTQNLSDFLQMSAGDITHNRYEIWIDALCIDQQNSDEVASQILLMGDIYGFAEQVCVWLGAADDDNGEARDVANLKWLLDNALPKLSTAYGERGRAFLNLCSATMPTDGRFWSREMALEPPAGVAWIELWVSYFRFFTARTWFSRAWVIQEAVLASLAAVIVGQTVVPWHTLHHLDRLVHLPRWGQVLSLHEARFPRNLQAQLMGYMDGYAELGRPVPAAPRNYHGQEIPSWYATLERALMAARLKTATVAKDKILCVLGLVQRNTTDSEFKLILAQLGSLQASPQSLFTSCTKLLLNHGGLHMLSLVQNAYLQGIPDLPSWVIDWSVSTAWWPLFRDATFRSTPPPREGKNQLQFVGSHLSVGGMHIDTVTGTHPVYRNVDPAISTTQRFNASDEAFYLLPNAVLEVLSVIGPIDSHNDTSAEDVLWHTLLLAPYGSKNETDDRSKGKDNQPSVSNPGENTPFYTPTTKHSCLEYLAFQLAASRIPEIETRIRNAISSLELRQQPPHTETLNSGLIMGMKKAMEMRRTREEAGGGHFHPSRGAAAFATQMIMKLKYRKLFTTAHLRVGVCSLPVEVQDEVWLLRGLPYPVVLRPQQARTGGQRRYRLMGDAYVYGTMYGEVQGSDDFARFGQVEIV
ncbi:heterokaryon incompatibility protein-domain-containing protein [Cercophora newfieldiana]|uniref:Heterokaryon incompatibility protein-domain-containing protein n=1 Tax=Cercophora newfieldiana TaxID=92897 RepID=A0AA39Y081_9PEZI|nr:heterokaryon incompatibility protein-domain-containing protein [Cercophora newfieldiana]